MQPAVKSIPSFSGVAVPDLIAMALAGSRFAEAADLPAATPQELFGRGLVRTAIGRENDARADFDAAMPVLGDACLLELAFLDLRQRADVQESLPVARDIARRAAAGSALLADHVAGLAEGKMRRTAAATDLLLKSARLYGELGDRVARAQVYDTLGSIQAARGRLDLAMHYFAMSIVEKSLLGDRAGIAISLGNMGRTHLRLGRFDDAMECFNQDLSFAEALGDRRGKARMLEDIGRAEVGRGDFPAAEKSFQECVECAQQAGYGDLVFFARKDLALLAIAQNRLHQAEAELKLAETALPGGAEPYLQQVLLAARGELLLARHDPAAVEALEQAVAAFVKADLPDLEIPARLLLSRALVEQKLKATAQDNLLKAMQRARADGYARYLPLLKEEMTRLDLVEGVIEEKSRPIVQTATPDGDGYVILQRLGGGGFGDVYRAYDSTRACDVAVKRFHTAELYDVRRRKSLMASARLELEAASRVRHPGLVRVLAIGFDPQGELYLVQDFVPGRPLRVLMGDPLCSEPSNVAKYLGQIASALAALHEGDVVHRDLKPDNVLVKPDGLPVLVDFGIAHLLRGGGPGLGAAIVGTPSYMSPEQARGVAIDGRSDLYSLGVIGYLWLSGAVPIHPRSESLREVAAEIMGTKVPHLLNKVPKLDLELAALIMALLAKEPADRPATAAKAAARFMDIANKMPARRHVKPPDANQPETTIE